MTENSIIKSPIESNGRGLVLRNLDDMYRFGQYVIKSGLAPRGLKTPEQVLIALESGAELGMPPMRALGSVCVINGQARLYGDAPLALVMQSGLLEDITEQLEGEDDDNFAAVCTVKRKGQPTAKTRKFSVADAKRADLWGKVGPWQFYPKRMLQMRARALALRDVFPDCFAGATIAEEYVGAKDETAEPKSAVLIQNETKTEEEGLPAEAGWTPEDLPVGAPPSPQWLCLDCGNKFGVPVPPNGLCPKCLSKEISIQSDEEIKPNVEEES
jgi:hypothetical protein